MFYKREKGRKRGKQGKQGKQVKREEKKYRRDEKKMMGLKRKWKQKKITLPSRFWEAFQIENGTMKQYTLYTSV